jgi:hypothetical protein
LTFFFFLKAIFFFPFATKLKEIVEPFEYEKYKSEKIQQKLEKERENRIRIKAKAPKVNVRTATRILQEGTEGSKKILQDPRFGRMFEDPNFAVDESDEKYRMYHPKPKKNITENDIAQHFDPATSTADDEDEENTSHSSDDLLEEEEEEEEEEGEGEEGEEENILDDEDLEKRNNRNNNDNNNNNQRQPQFYEVKTGHDHLLHKNDFLNSRSSLSSADRKTLSFAKRLSLQNGGGNENNNQNPPASGSLQMTFIPQKVTEEKVNRRQKKAQERQTFKQRTEGKRGVQELRLPSMDPKGRYRGKKQ